MTVSVSSHDRGQAGFTIVEAMVACVLLLVGMVATLTIVERAASVTTTTRGREQATSLQRELVEAARSVAYDKLTPNGIGPAIRAKPALGDASLSAAGWTVRRRGVTYSVAVGVCTVDDPRDGIGAHPAGIFCADTAPAPADANLDGTVDSLAAPGATTCGAPCPDVNAADYKRLVALVRWDGTRSNVQTSQISNPGVASAPAVTNLYPPSLASPYVISDTRASLGLTTTWTGDARTVSVYLDGTPIATTTSPTGGTWDSSWNLGTVAATGAQPSVGEIVDGTYELSAKAFDQYDQYGTQKSATITVNRRQTFAPLHVAAGRNGGSVEIEWSPAKELDNKGFKVERRVNGGAWQLACPMAVQTACQDAAAPAPQTGRILEYSVVGYDLDPSGALRAGDRSLAVPILDTVVVTVAPPTNLAATLTAGTVTLTWTAPAGATPDHYNVYRDGTAYPDRLDSAYFRTADPLRYVDTGTGGTLHDYWITAVDASLHESAKLGPVRR